MRLPEFAVRHSVFGNMLTVVVIVAGILIVSQMQREVFPEISLDIVTVTMLYPSASSEEVEDRITHPIEDAIRDVTGISLYTSSSIEGVSLVFIEVDPEARNKDRIITEIQRKIDQINDFPDEALDPDINVLTTQGPIIRIAVGGPAEERAIQVYADFLKTRLEQVPGVGSIDRDGWRDEEFWVELDLDRLDAFDLAPVDVGQALASRNISLPGGRLRENGRERVLRTIGQFQQEADIGNVIVRSDPDGNHVRVRDVGTVTRTFAEADYFIRANGHRAVVLGVKKTDRADTIETVQAIQAIIAAERDRLPENIKLTLVDDESYYVQRRLQVLSMNGLLGMSFVLICLFIFLNFRVALITAIGIPFSFLSAFLLMKFYGVTINMMTMFGLIVVLGMVVDDAIIVGENIFRHMEMGKTPRAAAIEGTQEVMYPLITTVLTSCAAFLPLIFAPDIYAEFLKWLPIVVIMTLAGSLFESLIILPCHVADFVPAFKREQADPTGHRHAHRWMNALIATYARALRVILRYRYRFLACVLVAFLGMGLWSFRTMRIDIFPADMIDIFFVRLAVEEGTQLDETGEFAEAIDQMIHQLPSDELHATLTYVGGHVDVLGGLSARGTHYASLAVHLTPQNKRSRPTRQIIDELRAELAGFEGIERLEFEPLSPGPPVGRPLEAKLIGSDFDVLETLAEEMRAFLETLPGVRDIMDDFDAGKEELHVHIDHDEAARLGLDLRTIAQSIAAAFQGMEATDVREGREDLTVRVRLAEPARNDPYSLHRIMVPNDRGRLIPLAAVAEIRHEIGLPAIEHYMGERAITVSADIDTDVTSSVEVNRAILDRFGDLHLEHTGYRLVLTGEWEETQKLIEFMQFAFNIAILIIFSILVVQFNSLFQPFVVILSIPLGLIGVTLALILHDMPISVMALMGMVGLAGVAVNDAIVLVNFINRRRAEGASVESAVFHAAETRFRPIVLTTVTTMSGLLPVIYGWGGYEPFIAPSAVTLGYGLLFASFLTLFVVPCLYYAASDLRERGVRVVKRLRRVDRAAPVSG